MAFQWIQYQYPIEQQFEKMILWVDSSCRLYFALKDKDTDDWTYFSGTASHGLGAGSTLVNRGNSESSAQTNYWLATPDSNNRIIAVLPTPELAKYVRVYIDDTNNAPTQIYEFKPSTAFVADEIISGSLTITDEFNSPPIITVSSGGKDRIKIGDLGNTFGIKGYDDSSNVIFELSASTQQIAGFYFTGDVIASTGIVLDSANKRISVNSTTFGDSGIQLQYNSGTPRFYTGNGSDKFFKYDGTNISWKGTNAELTTSGSLNVSNLQADGGNIAGWEISATKLKSSSSGRRIELNESKDRISIFDSADNEKVVMGYLNGLTKNASPSEQWGSDDYGFYAAAGDHLKIDGNATYFSGDWIIKHDAAYKVLDASDNEILRLGTNSGKKGLFIWNNTGTLLAESHSDGVIVGDTSKTDNYIEYTQASGLTIVGSILVKNWAHPSDQTKINGGQIYTQSITTDQIAANAVHASQIYTAKLSALSANLGQVIAGDIVGVDIRTATSGQRVAMDSNGLRLETGATTFTYGDSSHTYGDSTRKYGSGVLAYVLHPVKSIPFYVNEEQSVADFHFYDRSSDPTGEAEDGDTCYSGGEFKVCTSGGTPGTFEALAYADLDNVTGTAVYNKLDFTASHHTNGYQKLPSGLIIQWGQVSNDGTGEVSFSFPISFPSQLFSIAISDNEASSAQHTTYVIGRSTSGATIRWRTSDGALNNDTDLFTTWIAIGN